MDRAALREHAGNFRRSISTKIMLIMIALILPFNILSIMLGNRTMESIEEQAGAAVETVLNNTASGLLNRMQNSQFLVYNIRYKKAEGLTMARQADDSAYAAAKIHLYYDIKAELELMDAADVVYFFMTDINDVLIWDARSMMRYQDEQYIRENFPEKLRKGWHVKEINGYSAACLSIRLRNVIYGAWIDLDAIANGAAKDIPYESARVTVSEDRPEPEKGRLTVSKQVGASSVWLNASVDRREIVGNISGLHTVLRYGSFAALILIPALYLLIQYLLLSPLRRLVRGQKHVQEGDLDYRISERSSSIEYNHVFESFNEMVSTIQNLKIENYEQELNRQQLELANQSLELERKQLELDNRSLELKNLRLQIHPHFLLNTFNLIYTLAKRGKSEEIQKAIVFLSDYFRYLFRSENHLELFGKEQHIVESYLEIAALRYPGRIDAEYEYDPELAYVRVPPLLLQNFVENIVKYAADQERVTHISIVGQYEDGLATFMIMDDGPGMPEEKIRELYETMRQKTDPGMHIGYYNSYHRLKYFYGDEAELEVSSDPGEGTCVTIRFPYNLESSGDTGQVPGPAKL